jgi:hypothetical protein
VKRKKGGRYVQVWLEMTLFKNTSVLVCTFFEECEKNGGVTSNGF